MSGKSLSAAATQLPYRHIVIATIIALCLALFAAYAIYLPQSALCCADDDMMAVVAKNLATGHGYSVTAHWLPTPALSPFDPWITTGPTLIVPAALLIWLFGSLTWLPGIPTLVTTFATLAAMWFVAARRVGHLRASLFVGILLFLLWLTIMPFQWVTLFGDLPAAMLAALAVLIYAQAPQQRGAVALASFVFGLAVLTKLLVALLFLPLGAWLLYRAIFFAPRRQSVALLVISAVCVTLPLIAFEIGKLLSLGPAAYLDLLSRTIGFASGMGASRASRGIMEAIAANAQEFRKNYIVSPWLLIATSIIGFLLIQQSNSPESRRAYALFATAALLNWVWFLTMSTGWGRYIIPGLVFDAAAMATLVTSYRSFRSAAPAFLAVLLHVATFDRGLSVVNAALDRGLEEEPRIASLKAAAEMLRQLPQDTVLIGSWWATVSGMEYLLPGADNFRYHSKVPIQAAGKPMVVARDTRWSKSPWWPDAGFAAWESVCAEVIFEKEPFVISRCPAADQQSLQIYGPRSQTWCLRPR